MRVEGDEGDARLAGAGAAEEGLVAEVQAVEGADAGGGGGRERDGLPQDLHGAGGSYHARETGRASMSGGGSRGAAAGGARVGRLAAETAGCTVGGCFARSSRRSWL